MRWIWHRRKEERVEAEHDLMEARLARIRAERATERVRSRWGLVYEVTSESRLLRHENHLAQSVIELFRSHR